MAKYEITDNKTGKTVVVEGSRPPTTTDAEAIFQKAGLRQTSQEPQKGILGQATDFLFGRTKDYLSKESEALKNRSLGENLSNDALSAISPLLGLSSKVENGKLNFDKQGLGTAGEIASYMIPSNNLLKGAGAGQKILGGAIQGAEIGAVSGVTDPTSDTLKQRVEKGVTQGVIGGATGGIVQGLFEVGKAGVKSLVGNAADKINKIIRPNPSALDKFKKNTGLNYSEEIVKRDAQNIEGMGYSELQDYFKSRFQDASGKVDDALSQFDAKNSSSNVANAGLYDTPLYHGTDAKFDNFDFKKTGLASGEKPVHGLEGVWLTNDKNVAAGYGKNIKEAKVDTSNFHVVDAKGATLNDFRDELWDAKKYVKDNNKSGLVVKNLVDNKDWSNEAMANHIFVVDKKAFNVAQQPISDKAISKSWLKQQFTDVFDIYKDRPSTSKRIGQDFETYSQYIDQLPENIPLSVANQLKRDLQELASAAYGNTSNSVPKAYQKVAARLNKEITNIFPEASKLNKETQLYRLVSDAVSRTGSREQNKISTTFVDKLLQSVPTTGGALATVATGNPLIGLGTLLAGAGASKGREIYRSPEVQTKLASMISKGVSPSLKALERVLESTARKGGAILSTK